MKDSPKITAETHRLGAFMAGAILEPAVVQREFRWDAEHSRRLVDDLTRAFDDGASDLALLQASHATDAEGADVGEATHMTLGEDASDADLEPPTPSPFHDGLACLSAAAPSIYYFGSVVLLPAGDGRLQIYDGLQRLTVLTILLAVLRDTVGDDALADTLDRAIATEPAGAGDPRLPRLRLRSGQRMIADEIVPRGEAAIQRRQRRGLSETELRLREVVKEVLAQISRWPVERRRSFARWLMDRAMLTTILVTDAPLARRIFVSTNIHGVRLASTDILKGQLVELAPDEATAARVAELWGKLERTLEGDLEEFLLAVDFLDRRKLQGPERLAEIAAELERHPRPDRVTAWLEHWLTLATSWTDLDRRMRQPERTPLDAAIWRLGLFKWGEWKPLALLWIERYWRAQRADGSIPKKDLDRVTERFAALSGRCLAMTLARFQPHERATIFARAVGQQQRGASVLTQALAFKEEHIRKMRQTLEAPLTDREIRGTLLRWLEASYWEHPPHWVAFATVEHVLPENPAPGSQWLRDFADDDKRYDSTHSLGNLAALDDKRQGPARNLDFADKRAVYDAEPRYRTLADVLEHKAWTRDAIRRREKALVRRVFEVLALPDPPKRAGGDGEV